MDRDEKAQELPPIPLDLAQALDSIFPVKYPELTDSDRKIWYMIGARSVVEFLLEHQRKQADDSILN